MGCQPLPPHQGRWATCSADAEGPCAEGFPKVMGTGWVPARAAWWCPLAAIIPGVPDDPNTSRQTVGSNLPGKSNSKRLKEGEKC